MCIRDRFDCYVTHLKHVASWIDINGHEQTNFECSCAKQGTCQQSAQEQSCNCDASPPVLDWMTDIGKITNRTLLPITGFKYGFLRGKANITIGNLHCKGVADVGPSRDSCNAIK